MIQIRRHMAIDGAAPFELADPANRPSQIKNPEFRQVPSPYRILTERLT